MKIEPFCAWGDGPDVGINLETSTRFIDLTADEADELAEKLKRSAAQARELERGLQEYEAWLREEDEGT